MSVEQSSGPPFTGSSPPDEVDEGVAPEKPDLVKAIERAAEKAGKAGYGGRPLNLSVQVVAKEHNQWVVAFSATLSG
jgi:hypothetical protein